MNDLVLQGPGLSNEALDTFKVVCMPERITVTRRAARCVAVRDDAETRKAVHGLSNFWKLDYAFVDPKLRLADFCLLALDMDSTLVNIETLDEVAAYAGKGSQVAAITESAMRGEVDYKESLRRRVAMLAGVDAALLNRVHDEKLLLNGGAQRLVAECRRERLKILLATGGFTFFTERVREKLPIDYARSNELEIIEGRLTGNVFGPNGGEIVDAEGKAQAVREACAEIGCATAKAIVVGDGANDIKMMRLAGISVAYRAKAVVREQATYALNHSALDGVLNWFTETSNA
ncbi:MAG TPA: phosphoserine phosphatase SerB [Burkholderiaceae bacterium]|nr:phosphoserine phosphatase SerB [Burkholderiaceae bacterium]